MSRNFFRPRSRRWRSGKWGDSLLAFIILAVLTFVADRWNEPAQTRTGGNASIHDGDTLTIGGERIRLVGIDAPELRQVCRLSRMSYPCGEESRDALIALIDGRDVQCIATKRDRYRRLLGTCNAGGDDLNAAQVRRGWAVTYGKGFEAEELQARTEKLGLWAGSFEDPKAWRKRHGDMAELEFDPLVEWFVRLGEKLGLM